MAKTSTKDGFLSTEQVAVLAGMSRQAIEGQIKAGNIVPCVRVGRVRLFSRGDVRMWLNERKRLGITKRGPKPSNGNKRSK